MSVAKGGWDVITTSHPPVAFSVGGTCPFVIDYRSDDAEPVERKDTIVVGFAQVRVYRHIVSFFGHVVDGGDVPELAGRVVLGAVDPVTRKGFVQLSRPGGSSAPQPE